LSLTPIKKLENVNANLVPASSDTVNATRTENDAQCYVDAKNAETKLRNSTSK
jgi:hypothetical protein